MYGSIEIFALICQMSLTPMYFVVQSKEKLKLKIVFPYLGQCIQE